MDRPLLSGSRSTPPPSYHTLTSSTEDVRLKTISVVAAAAAEERGGPDPNDNIAPSAKPYDETTYDELVRKRNVDYPTSNFETMIHILKGNIGTGVLALPQAFIYSGLAFGSVGLAVVAFICIHCMLLLLRCTKKLCIKAGIPSMDYATTAEYAFRLGPHRHRWFAPYGRLLTNIFICITQFGFCIVYWVFVATNIQTAVLYFYPECEWNYRVYMSILILPIVLVSFVSNLKYLAPLMIAANVFEVVAFACIFYYLFQDVPSVQSRRQMPTLEDLPLWFGTVVYAFEGIALVLPLENNMRSPRSMGGWLGVLNVSMTIVCLWYVGVAFFGYLKYGDELKGSITLSLPAELLSMMVQILYAAAIFFSIFLQFYVPMEIMWPAFRKYASKQPRIWQAVFRIFLIAIIFGLGAFIPEFELYISLVGAFGGSYLSLIFPIVIHLLTFWPDGMPWYEVTKDIFIVLFGILGFATGTYSSVLAIVNAFKDE